MNQKQKEQVLNIFSDFISQSLLAPFEYYKINLQLDPMLKEDDILKDKLWNINSVKTFFTGNLIGCASFFIKKFLNEYLQKTIEKNIPMEDEHPLGELYSLMVYNFIPYLITFPLEIIKTRMIYFNTKNETYLESIKNIYNEGSYFKYIEAFFYSFFEVPIYKFYHKFHQYLFKRYLIKEKSNHSTIIENIVALHAVDLISSALIYPIDTLSRRMIMKDVEQKDGSKYEVNTEYNINLFNGIFVSFAGFLVSQGSKFLFNWIKDKLFEK